MRPASTCPATAWSAAHSDPWREVPPGTSATSGLPSGLPSGPSWGRYADSASATSVCSVGAATTTTRSTPAVASAWVSDQASSGLPASSMRTLLTPAPTRLPAPAPSTTTVTPGRGGSGAGEEGAEVTGAG